MAQERIFYKVKRILPGLNLIHSSGGLPTPSSDVDISLVTDRPASLAPVMPKGTRVSHKKDGVIYHLPEIDGREVNIWAGADKDRVLRAVRHRDTTLALAKERPDLVPIAQQLKADGHGTEGAWARTLRVNEDPYKAMLDKDRMVRIAKAAPDSQYLRLAAQLQDVLDASGVPPEGIVIAGSGYMGAKKLKTIGDFDVNVHKKSDFEKLKRLAGTESVSKSGSRRVEFGDIEMFYGPWMVGGEDWSGPEGSVNLHGFPHWSGKKTLEWKKTINRPKDAKDIALLEPHVKTASLHDITMAAFADEMSKIAGVGWSVHGYGQSYDKLQKASKAAELASKQWEDKYGKEYYRLMDNHKYEEADKYRAQHPIPKYDGARDYRIGQRVKTPYQSEAENAYKLNMHLDYNRKGKSSGSLTDTYASDYVYGDKHIEKILSKSKARKFLRDYKKMMSGIPKDQRQAASAVMNHTRALIKNPNVKFIQVEYE